MTEEKNRPTAPVIFGCAGAVLNPEERVFFKAHNPLGFILFKRNIQEKNQVKTLINQLKETVDHEDPPILIDQEGGRVARLTPPFWAHYPCAQGPQDESLDDAKKRVYLTYSQMGEDLKELGITVNCAPVLDLDIKGADPIMGDRTFSANPDTVAQLGAVAIKALLDKGITPVIKHIPGHGAAECDSHKALPTVTLSHQDLKAHFAPFKANNNCPWAMTAHIVYQALDPHHPATESPHIIQTIIRKEIGFKGFLVSDDIGMKALTGSFADRTKRALKAGCDAVLHCSGNLDEMIEVVSGL